MTCADESDGTNMSVGDFVNTKLGIYTIKDELGKGGYGAVYRVQLQGTTKEFALKAEKKLTHREHSKLNMELHILKAMDAQAEGKSHFAKVYDRSKKNKFYFIVMSLLGESLSDLKKRHRPPIFRLNTGYAAALQCLEAIEELHRIGFIHRDIKPGNYSIGLGKLSSTVYILDFGIARKILNDKDELKVPRVPFKGTVRFAPVATHEGKELSYKDDCESWIYLVTDMCNPRGVSWKMEREKDKVLQLKRDARSPKGKQDLFYSMSVEEFGRALDYLSGLEYTDKVDYNFLYGLVKQAARNQKLTLAAPYDWDIMSTTETSEVPSSDSMPGSSGEGKQRAAPSSTT
ncbi:protein kinase domain-containing protein [Ditylenchus destructor]|nr:protein kinase domain-containing protein [Ditylenchus destructor]